MPKKVLPPNLRGHVYEATFQQLGVDTINDGHRTACLLIDEIARQGGAKTINKAAKALFKSDVHHSTFWSKRGEVKPVLLSYFNYVHGLSRAAEAIQRAQGEEDDEGDEDDEEEVEDERKRPARPVRFADGLKGGAAVKQEGRSGDRGEGKENAGLDEEVAGIYASLAGSRGGGSVSAAAGTPSRKRQASASPPLRPATPSKLGVPAEDDLSVVKWVAESRKDLEVLARVVHTYVWYLNDEKEPSQAQLSQYQDLILKDEASRVRACQVFAYFENLDDKQG